jgi:hypothetical protein
VKERCCFGSPISSKVVVPNDDYDVGGFHAVLDDPKSTSCAEQRSSRKINYGCKQAKHQKSQQAEDDAAVLAAPHLFGSS